MNLSQYIEKHGNETCAERFGVSLHTIKSWRWSGKSSRKPRPDKANEIVAITGGEVSLAGIYAKPNK
jgi:hypothetical protein